MQLSIVAVMAVRATLPRKATFVILLGLIGVTAAQTALLRPVLYVQGYTDAVDYVAQNAPQGSVVLFSGYRDGAFVFNMRAREDRRDLYVLRADKLLLRVSVRRELGVEQKPLSEAEIADLINRSGVHYVVAQPGFWTDLDVMRRLENVLHTPRLEEVARIPISANFPAEERELVIYRNLGQVAEGPIELNLELPIINRSLSGTVGKSNNGNP